VELQSCKQLCFNSRVEYVRTLATMGTDLSLKHERGPGGGNVFDNAQQSNFSPEEKTAVFKVLAEHGVTSRNIPRGFQSPLYFRSIYYQDNVRTQRWINRSPLILSANRLYNWSIENQIEAQVHRTLPADLSSAGYLVSHCFFDIGGGRPDNGIARLITQFYGGFNEGKAKNPIALIGMPVFGKNTLTLPRCSYCDKEYCEASGGGVELCCKSVYYCRHGDCKKLHLPQHEALCVCYEVMEKRKIAAAGEEARSKESAQANDEAEAAAGISSC
jgi:hypothetical protein